MGLATAALAALVAAGGSVAAPPDPARIVGGAPTEACAWPTVVSLGRLCTGTLVHPRVVIYAAHCGDGFSSVELGTAAAPRHTRTVATERCETWPDGFLPGAGRDWAYCVLASPQDDLPIVPPLMGCETDALVPGASTTLVGFGTSEVGYGDKRSVSTRINAWVGDEIGLGGDGRDSCEGDSGGPAFVQLPGGQWRVFGIISYGETCGDGGFASLMHVATPWVEARSGFDISPCFDADGTWSPTTDCDGFSATPDDGRGAWDSGCAQPRESMARTCGAPFDAQGDAEPPTLSFIDPPGTLDAGLHPISVQARDMGSGLHTIRLSVDGLAVNEGTAWMEDATFDVEFERGEHQVLAVATDRAGNRAEETVTVVVSTDPDEPSTDDSMEAGCDCKTGSGHHNSTLILWGWMFSLGWCSRRSRRTCYPRCRERGELASRLVE